MTPFTASLHAIRKEYAKGNCMGLCLAASASGAPPQHHLRFLNAIVNPLLPCNNGRGSKWLGEDIPWTPDHPGRQARLMLMDLVILMHEEAE